jgi:hypothetical protein
MYVKKIWPDSFRMQGYESPQSGYTCKTIFDLIREDPSQVFSQAILAEYYADDDDPPDILDQLPEDISTLNDAEIMDAISDLGWLPQQWAWGGVFAALGMETWHEGIRPGYKTFDFPMPPVVGGEVYAQYGRTLCDGIPDMQYEFDPAPGVAIDSHRKMGLYTPCYGFVVDPALSVVERCVPDHGFSLDQKVEENPNRRTFVKLQTPSIQGSFRVSLYRLNDSSRFPNQVTLKRLNGEYVPVVMKDNTGVEMMLADDRPFYDQVSLERHHPTPGHVWQNAWYEDVDDWVPGRLGNSLHVNPGSEVGYMFGHEVGGPDTVDLTDTSVPTLGYYWEEDCPFNLRRAWTSSADRGVYNLVDCNQGWNAFSIPTTAGATVCSLDFTETIDVSLCYSLEIGMSTASGSGGGMFGVELKDLNGGSTTILYEGEFSPGLTKVPFSTNPTWGFVPATMHKMIRDETVVKLKVASGTSTDIAGVYISGVSFRGYRHDRAEQGELAILGTTVSSTGGAAPSPIPPLRNLDYYNSTCISYFQSGEPAPEDCGAIMQDPTAISTVTFSNGAVLSQSSPSFQEDQFAYEFRVEGEPYEMTLVTPELQYNVSFQVYVLDVLVGETDATLAEQTISLVVSGQGSSGGGGSSDPYPMSRQLDGGHDLFVRT